MAVFLCAADESKDPDTFFYGGWGGPMEVWEGSFADAWNERVLNGPPQIPYLHMTDIREWNWQTEYGLTPWKADRRIDSAADVLRSTGSLVPVTFQMSRAEFHSLLRQRFTPRVRQRDTFEPDFVCFMYFAMSQLDMLHKRFGSEVERVDFWVEENGKVSRHMEGFHKAVPGALKYIGRTDLIPLVGEFRSVQKECIPTQAADALAWHARNLFREGLDTPGMRRLAKMVEGGRRFGVHGDIDGDVLTKLAEGFAKSPEAWERPPWDEGEAEA